MPLPPGVGGFLPTLFSSIIGVVPPGPGAATGVACITDRERAKTFVKVDSLGAHIIAGGAGLPVFSGLLFNPLVEDGEEIFTVVECFCQPDEVVDTGQFVGQAFFFNPQNVGNPEESAISVTQADHLGLRVFAHQLGRACEDRVGDQQMPGIGADFKDVFRDLLKEFELVVVNPEGLIVHDMVAATEAIAEFFGDFDTFVHASVSQNQGSVDHEISAI